MGGKYCLWPEYDNSDSLDLTRIIGAKGKNLREIQKLFPQRVPSWFSVTVDAYQDIELEKAVNSEQDFLDQLTEYFNKLFDLSSSGLFVVRSSATVEDNASSSFAGLFTSYFGIETIDAVNVNIRKCWQSITNNPGIKSYSKSLLLNIAECKMGVIIQQQLQPDVAGVLFTANPINNDTGQYVIESNWGLGLSVVNGSVTPDSFIVSIDKSFEIDKRISSKDSMIYASKSELITQNVPDHLKSRPTLNDEQIIELSKIAKSIADYFGSPQDIEWALEGDHFFILQSRPITTLGW